MVSEMDSIRSGLGAYTLRGLSSVAAWLNYGGPSARYANMASSITATFLSRLLRWNGSEAFFVDGVEGSASKHAAIHSLA